MTALLFATLCAAVMSGLLTGLMRRYALRARLLDMRNERSSHSAPVPRGGGVAIVAASCGGLLGLSVVGLVPRIEVLVTVGSASLIAITGFIDDRRGLEARTRFAVHLLAALLLLGFGPPLPAMGWTWVDALPAMRFVLVTIGLVWLLNLYNFMDGIDGLAASQAVCASIGLVVVAVVAGKSGHAVWFAALLAGSSLGFLYWNWSPARIFMGDAGSGFLGFALGALALAAMRESGLTVHVPLILLAAFITDATYTLARRVLRGSRWYQAHRSHAYQRLARRAGSHRPVAIGVLLVNLAWLLPLSLLAALRPGHAGLALAAAYLPLLGLVAWAGAGADEQTDG